MFPSILIVDDEPTILTAMAGVLGDEGFEVITATNGYEALKLIDTETPDLVLLDVWMPGIDGLETLTEIKKNHPFLQVIIISGHGNIETAVRATKLGAHDFIEKPLSIDRVIVAINNALNFRRIEEENRYLRKKTLEKNSITGRSAVTQQLRKAIQMAAPRNAGILITGENGTGKELVARTIHQLSARAMRPMIDINCAAIPEDVIESELFGHEKGMFSGAAAKKRGKFEMADGGTLFLDEVGDLSQRSQGKLLRVLEEKRFERVGGSRTFTVDVRIIAATNQQLDQAIQDGLFREELYYRLNVIPIHVAPLRDRAEDIPELVQTFLAESSRENRMPPKTMTDAALALLQQYPWPGNVRELKNLVERLAIMVEGETIDVGDIPEVIGRNGDACDWRQSQEALFQVDRLKDAKRLFEQAYLRRKLAECDHNIAQTASTIGVARSYLYKKIKNIEPISK